MKDEKRHYAWADDKLKSAFFDSIRKKSVREAMFLLKPYRYFFPSTQIFEDFPYYEATQTLEEMKNSDIPDHLSKSRYSWPSFLLEKIFPSCAPKKQAQRLDVIIESLSERWPHYNMIVGLSSKREVIITQQGKTYIFADFLNPDGFEQLLGFFFDQIKSNDSLLPDNFAPDPDKDTDLRDKNVALGQ